MSVNLFLERALLKVDSMTSEEVLALHREAAEVIQDPVFVEYFEGVLFISSREEISSDIQR